MPITINELQNLLVQYLEVVRHIDQINHQNGDLNEILRPNDQRIKQIQMPFAFSQSFIYYYIVNNPRVIGLDEINENDLYLPGNLRDFDVVYQENDSKINIEVKGNGQGDGFQRFRLHALESDYVFWLKLRKNENNYFFDLAVFNPDILTELVHNINNEVLITWVTLINNYSDRISLFPNVQLH